MEFACFNLPAPELVIATAVHNGHDLRPDLAGLDVVRMARPKLIKDGMFLVGLDIVGDKLMEANVFSPGGLGSAASLHEVDFASAVIEALERKLLLRASYGPSLTNVALATM